LVLVLSIEIKHEDITTRKNTLTFSHALRDRGGEREREREKNRERQKERERMRRK
jgi:hypothetical protein